MAYLLEDMPCEILDNIFEALVPENPPMLPIYREYLDRKDALWGLTLMNRRIGGTATRYLYRNVFIEDHKQLILLFRTLYENRDLRVYTKLLVSYPYLLHSRKQPFVEADMRIHFPGLRGILLESMALSTRWIQSASGTSEVQLVKNLWVDAILSALRKYYLLLALCSQPRYRNKSIYVSYKVSSVLRVTNVPYPS